MALQSQDRSLKVFRGECREDSAQTNVLVLYCRCEDVVDDVVDDPWSGFWMGRDESMDVVYELYDCENEH